MLLHGTLKILYETQELLYKIQKVIYRVQELFSQTTQELPLAENPGIFPAENSGTLPAGNPGTPTQTQLIPLPLFRVPGEYFVVGISIEPYDPRNPEKYLKDSFKQEVMSGLQEYYKNYLGIVPSPAQDFEKFSRKVNEYLEKPPFHFGNPLAALGKEKKVSNIRILPKRWGEKIPKFSHFSIYPLPPPRTI